MNMSNVAQNQERSVTADEILTVLRERLAWTINLTMMIDCI